MSAGVVIETSAELVVSSWALSRSRPAFLASLRSARCCLALVPVRRRPASIIAMPRSRIAPVMAPMMKNSAALPDAQCLAEQGRAA
jgi:hypothetical protein